MWECSGRNENGDWIDVIIANCVKPFLFERAGTWSNLKIAFMSDMFLLWP